MYFITIVHGHTLKWTFLISRPQFSTNPSTTTVQLKYTLVDLKFGGTQTGRGDTYSILATCVYITAKNFYCPDELSGSFSVKLCPCCVTFIKAV